MGLQNRLSILDVSEDVNSDPSLLKNQILLNSSFSFGRFNLIQSIVCKNVLRNFILSVEIQDDVPHFRK